MPGVVTVDLHGMNAYQARVKLDSTLRRVDGSVYRLRVVHGFWHGDVLKNMLDEYAAHPRVIKLERGTNPGQTDLVLRNL